MSMLETVAVPAYQSELLSDIFEEASFQETTLPDMAVMEDPSVGFGPTRLEDGTEVLWMSGTELAAELGSHIASMWNHGLGLVLFRNREANCAGSIFIHGAMKTPWSARGAGAWHSLGGIMAFSGLSFEDSIEMVLGKGMAMTPKWRFIDSSLASAGHPTLTHLGGARRF